MAHLLLEDLSPSIKTLGSLVTELRTHIELCKASGRVLDKNVVLPIFRCLAGLQTEWKTQSQQRGHAAAENYVDNQFSPSIKSLGVNLVAAMQDPAVISKVEQELRMYPDFSPSDVIRSCLCTHLWNGEHLKKLRVCCGPFAGCGYHTCSFGSTVRDVKPF